jgi:hypothetical protein
MDNSDTGIMGAQDDDKQNTTQHRKLKRWATQTLLSEESLKDEQHRPYYQKRVYFFDIF